jgi:hypothetical protein
MFSKKMVAILCAVRKVQLSLCTNTEILMIWKYEEHFYAGIFGNVLNALKTFSAEGHALD